MTNHQKDARIRHQIRWDTVAAIASAIGALASALVAILALRFAHVQETTAEKQLEATYQANLYSKQVDSFAEYRESIYHLNDFFRGRSFDELAKANPSDAQARAAKIADEYQNLVYTMQTKRRIFGILTPPQVLNAMNSEGVSYSRIQDALSTFVHSPPTLDSLRALASAYDSRFAGPAGSSAEALFECVKNAFDKSEPVTSANIKDCNLPAK